MRTRFLVGWLVRRRRILLADLLLPHFFLTFFGVLDGSVLTTLTTDVCRGFFFVRAVAPPGTATASASAPSATDARTTCDIRLLPR